MAKKAPSPMAKQANPYRQIISEIRARRFAPVYILSGETPYYLDLIADALMQHVVPEEDRDFNQHVYYGQDAQIDDIVNTARQYPVMSDHKLVILREAQTMDRARSALENLVPYLKHPCPTTVLAIHFKGDAFKATSELVKAARQAKGIIYSVGAVRDYELPAVLRDYCHENGVTLEPKAADMLCNHIGTDLQRLFGEIEKLRLTLPPSDHVSISADMVAAHTGISKQYNGFELKSALMKRDYAKCMAIAAYYAANPNAKESRPEMIAPVIFGAFANLLQAHYTADKSDNGLSTALGIRALPVLRELKEGMRNYSAWSCLRAIHAVRDYDRHTKGIGSAQPRTALLYDLIYRLFTQ